MIFFLIWTCGSGGDVVLFYISYLKHGGPFRHSGTICARRVEGIIRNIFVKLY